LTRALVIGGTGFVGQAACRELMRRGVETIAASRSEHPYGTFTSHRVLDRTKQADLKRVLDEVMPDVVLDLAAYQPADIRGVEAAFRGERYVFVSTGVYPALQGVPAREEDFVPYEGEPPAGVRGPPRAQQTTGSPRNRQISWGLDYQEGKRWCETLIMRSSLPWTIVRPPAIFGPSDPTLRIAAYIQRVEDGGPLLVPEESYRRQAGLSWVRDIGYACALACDLRREIATRRAYNAAFQGVGLEDLVVGIGRAMGRTPELVPVAYADLPDGASPYGPDPARSAGYVLDRARADLGFSPSTLEEALAETLAWYQVRRPSHPGYANRARELELARKLAGF
jgi:nucleoside-diphosphate-sugar epimerase